MWDRICVMINNRYSPRIDDFFPKLTRGHTTRGHCCSGQDHVDGNQALWAEERSYKALVIADPRSLRARAA